MTGSDCEPCYSGRGQALQKALRSCVEGRARQPEPGQHKGRNSVCELERHEASEGQLASAIRGHVASNRNNGGLLHEVEEAVEWIVKRFRSLGTANLTRIVAEALRREQLRTQKWDLVICTFGSKEATTASVARKTGSIWRRRDAQWRSR